MHPPPTLDLAGIRDLAREGRLDQSTRRHSQRRRDRCTCVHASEETLGTWQQIQVFLLTVCSHIS